MMRKGSESLTGRVEAPVLEGATGVMTNEGHGLGEAEWRGSTTRAGG